MPSASVTAKIASISFIVTTSSTQADLAGAGDNLAPRLVFDGDAGRAACALGARLRLPRHEDLLRTGRGCGAADPLEQRRHLRVKVRGRQKARQIERDDQGAVGELALLRARGAGAREDAAENLDRERETVALVSASGEQ